MKIILVILILLVAIILFGYIIYYKLSNLMSDLDDKIDRDFEDQPPY